MIKKVETLPEDIVSTEKLGDVIIVFTKRSVYVSGEKDKVEKFIKKYPPTNKPKT